jgi:hypothetical protein
VIFFTALPRSVLIVACLPVCVGLHWVHLSEYPQIFERSTQIIENGIETL